MSRSDFDLVVIGAGAAGLAAARRARELGLSVAILEAKDRIGGRAHTDSATFGVPWDRGAHWLHNASRNPFTAFADAEGFVYDQTPVERRLWSAGWADAALQAELDDYVARGFAAVRAAGVAGRDVAAAEVIPPHPRFRAMFCSWLAALAGVDPERLSTLDYARYEDGGGNWQVVDGYGALLARFGQGLPVELRTPVRRIRWGAEGGLGRDGARGPDGPRGGRDRFDERARAGRHRLRAAAARAPQEALAAVPLGEANKVAIGFERALFGPGESYRLHLEHRTRAAIRFEFRPFGRDLALGYLAGRFAAELEAEGPGAMAAFALDQLVEVFGSGLRRHIRASRAPPGAATRTSWAAIPAPGRARPTSARGSPSRWPNGCSSPARPARWRPTAPCTAPP